MQSLLTSRFFALFSVLLFVLLASELTQARTLFVNPAGTGTAPSCGSIDNQCRSLKAALKLCKNGDIIDLSVGVHVVTADLSLNKNIEITIQGKGKTLTAIKLNAGVSIDLFQVNLNLLDLTVSGGVGISVNAMAKVLNIVDLSVNVDLNVNLKRVQFLNCAKGLRLFAPDPSLLGVLGSINANIEACIFIGAKDVAVVIGARVDVTFHLCKWLSNLNAAIQIGGSLKDNRCPIIRIDACIFRNNIAEASLILGGSSDCDDLLIFVGLNIFDSNVAQVLIGYVSLNVEVGLFNYQCEDCDFRFKSNDIQAVCATYCESDECEAPPAFTSGLDVDICVGGLGIGLSLPLPLPLPFITLPALPNLPSIPVEIPSLPVEIPSLPIDRPL